MSIKNNLKRADVLFQNREFKSSLNLCQKLLIKRPKLFNAIHQAALNYQAMNNIAQAVVYFERAIAINDKNGTVFNNLGNIYITKEDYKKASRYYIKALSLEPNLAVANSNFALCQFKLGYLGIAEEYYKKAILYDAKNHEFYSNFGALYAEQGLFDNALEMLLKSLELKVTAQTYWEVFRIQLYLHRYQDALDVADMGIVSQPLEHELYQWLVGKAIVYWLFNKLDEVKHVLELSERIYYFENTSTHMKNMTIFHRYIKKLLAFRLAHNELYFDKDKNQLSEMYFISESHGLSPNATIVEYNKEKYQIHSLFIMGAKVFHLTALQDNRYQVSLAKLLEGIQPGSKVVIGFGEIDCRTNEGIYVYCLKSRKDYKQVIDLMLYEYIRTLKKIADAYELEIIIYGVPAPHPFYIDKLKCEDKNVFKDIILYFNTSLTSVCKKYDMKLLDVYNLTNLNGQSNLKYHIDANHLSPNTLLELFS